MPRARNLCLNVFDHVFSIAFFLKNSFKRCLESRVFECTAYQTGVFQVIFSMFLIGFRFSYLSIDLS